MEEENEEDKIIERIKKECLCWRCHGCKNYLAKCACTEECNILTRLQRNEEIAKTRRGLFTSDGVSLEALSLFGCANLARKIELRRKTIQYTKEGVLIYEKNDDIRRAQLYSEAFGLTELAEYYRKIIDLMANRPE